MPLLPFPGGHPQSKPRAVIATERGFDSFDTHAYRDRDIVERCINRLTTAPASSPARDARHLFVLAPRIT